MTEATISLVDPSSVLSLFGTRDQNLRRISDTFNVAITHRDGKIHVAGTQPDVSHATEALERLKTVVERQGVVGEEEVSEVLAIVSGEEIPARATSIKVASVGAKVTLSQWTNTN